MKTGLQASGTGTGILPVRCSITETDGQDARATSKRNIFLLLFCAMLTLITPLLASDSTNSTGLYYVSTNETGQTVETAGGSTIRLAEKAPMQILKANVYSENNANTDFLVWLSTSDYPVDPTTGAMPKPVMLRVGNRAYSCNGSGGRTGMYNDMQFNIKGQNEAETAARSLFVGCILRKPPGYKFLATFTPEKSAFTLNEPVLAMLSIKNLDDRTISFPNGGSQRGYRNNQFGFRTMFNYAKPVADIGDPVNFGGLVQQVNLKPGKTFETEVDLKKWFAFDKAGTYAIHGFYGLNFFAPGDGPESFSPQNILWSDYASDDFTVTIK